MEYLNKRYAELNMISENFKKMISMIFLLSSILLNSFAQESTSSVNITDTYTKLFKKQDVVGASIAIIDNGDLVYSKGFGYEDQENNKKATAQTVYRIGSITKTFTALGVMQLHEKGLLDINESIQKYIPELKLTSHYNDDNQFYIKDILAHSAGIPCDIFNGMIAPNANSLDWIIEELSKFSTIAPSRHINAYSNIGYSLLGALIERVSGLSYEVYLKQNIFQPLEMNSTGVGVEVDQLSKGYDFNKDAAEIVPIRDFPAGSITSNIVDMVNFTKMLLLDGEFKGKRIISKKSLTFMESNQYEFNFLETSLSYGAGIMSRKLLIDDGKDRFYTMMHGHGGDLESFHCDYGYIPSMDVGVIILTNSDGGAYSNKAAKVLKLYLEETRGVDTQIKFEIRPDKNSESILDKDILGTYNMGSSIIKMTDVDKSYCELDGFKVKLKRKGATSSYSLSFMLLGILPIKAKNNEIKFVKKDNTVYAKQVNLKHNTSDYFALKIESISISEVWKSKYGKYEIINMIMSGITNHGFQGVNSVVLMEENGHMILKFIDDSDELKYYLDVVNDEFAVTGGIGRDQGMSIKVLKNGNLYFGGFEMKQVIKY